jgi:signal transduction histidine kinase
LNLKTFFGLKPPDKTTLGFIRFIIGILFALEFSLAVLYFSLKIPPGNFVFIAVIMSLAAILSLTLVYIAYRLGWIYRARQLRWTIIAGYGISMLVVVLVITVIAKWVFVSINDVLLIGILLLFGSGIFISFGYILAETISGRINSISNAAREIAQGNLTERVPVTGNDEISKLGNTFNDMTRQLEDMDIHQKELRKMRSDLIVWVGHDLRTPLTSIRAILEALADRIVEDPETVQRYLDMAQKEVRYLSRLIDDLFDLSQIDAGGMRVDWQYIPLADLISDTLESFTELAYQQGVNLDGSIQPGIDLVYIDAQLIGRVLNNLTSNAIRYTPPGGTVNISAVKDNGKVTVTVNDNGDGIKAEDLPYIFERFFRGDKSRNRTTGGTGLGLAISRGIIEAHGETIRAESEEDVGTKIIFTIPEHAPQGFEEKIST